MLEEFIENDLSDKKFNLVFILIIKLFWLFLFISILKLFELVFFIIIELLGISIKTIS